MKGNERPLFFDMGSKNTKPSAPSAQSAEPMVPSELLKSHQLDRYEFDYDSINKEMWPDPCAERCKRWGVHPGAFDYQASFDRIFVWQVIPFDLEYKDGFWCLPGQSISIPPKSLDRGRYTAPRGILLSAGLEAMDELATNGIRIGDYVDFLRLTPFMKPVGFSPSLESIPVVLCSASDVTSSEDVATRRKAGKIKMVWKRMKLPDGGEFVGHVYEGEGIPDGCPPLRAEKREDL